MQNEEPEKEIGVFPTLIGYIKLIKLKFTRKEAD
jgi:hypothetical protein